MDIVDKLLYSKPVEPIDINKVQTAYETFINSPEGEIILKDLILSFQLQAFGCTDNNNENYFRQGQATIITHIKQRLYAEYDQEVEIKSLD